MIWCLCFLKSRTSLRGIQYSRPFIFLLLLSSTLCFLGFPSVSLPIPLRTLLQTALSLFDLSFSPKPSFLFSYTPLCWWSFQFPWLSILYLCLKYQIYILKPVLWVLVYRCLSASSFRCLPASQMQQISLKLHSRCGPPPMSPQSSPLQQLAPHPPSLAAWYQHTFSVISLKKHVKSFHWSSFSPLPP